MLKRPTRSEIDALGRLMLATEKIIDHPSTHTDVRIIHTIDMEVMRGLKRKLMNYRDAVTLFED